MKKCNLIMLALVGLLSLNSCGEDKKTDNNEDTAPMQNNTRMDEEDTPSDLDDGKVVAMAEFNDDAVASVYTSYLDLKTALVNSNAEEAQAQGKQLIEALQAVEGSSEAKEAAQTIADKSDLKEQRTAFSDLSAAMEGLVAGKVESGEVYKQYCPMAFDGKGGYWLSNSEEVRNPYYGDMMLKCGRVADTIQ